MTSAYSYPGCCGKDDCARETLACSTSCNLYAVHSDFCSDDERDREFTSNQQRETAGILHLSHRLATLDNSYFSIGAAVIRRTAVSPIPENVEACGPQHLFEEDNSLMDPVDRIFHELMCDANNSRHVEAAPPVAPTSSNLIENFNVAPELPMMDITLIPEEEFLAVAPNVPITPVPSSTDLSNFDMYVDQPSFNPNFNHSVLNEEYVSEGFIRDVFRVEGL